MARPTQKEAEDFLSGFPKLKATPSHPGNSHGGTSESLPENTINRFFHDGRSYVRLAMPMNVEKVGIEYDPDGKEYLRLYSPNNEGGWHNTIVDPVTSKVIGGAWDLGWPRTDRENKTPENGWQYGTGYWGANRHHFYHRWDREFLEVYVNNLKFTDIPEGIGKGTKGYEWVSDDRGFVLTGPNGLLLYGLLPFETLVIDPTDEKRAWSRNNTFALNFRKRGGGREVASFAPSYDFEAFPTDPRAPIGNWAGPGPLAAVRRYDETFVFIGDTDVMLHRWDESRKILVPVAFAAFGPNALHWKAGEVEHTINIPNAPRIGWGQGAIARVGNSGNFEGEWEVIPDLYGLMPTTGLNPLRAIDPATGDLYLTPAWKVPPTQVGERQVARWRVIDYKHGIFSTRNIDALTLPSHLLTAEKCEQIRIDYKAGDLYAVVQRDGQWNLEKYPEWLGTEDEMRPYIKPSYSEGPVCLTVRGNYEWYDTATGESFGTMAVCGEYVFIAEAQHMGLRVHNASDGSRNGRSWHPAFSNATIDHRAQIQVHERNTEFIIMLMDFHGKCSHWWRISKSELRKVKN